MKDRQTRISFTDSPRASASPDAVAESVASNAAVPMKVMPPDPWLTSRDEAVFLLQTTAEVEHALLVQYLYAAYSLDSSRFTDPLKAAAVDDWQDKILGIAKEEMAHLASMQNILRLLGGPIHLDRESFPSRSELSPFAFRLEPLTLRSLARYIAAEKPADILDQAVADLYRDQILPLSLEENNGELVNRVGLLFDRLHLLFRDPGTLPGETPPVEDADIQTDVGADLAVRSQWNRGNQSLIIGPAAADVTTAASARKAIRDVLDAIAAQGEGNQSSAPGTSHFDRFILVWKGYRHFFPDSPSDDIGPGAPALPVPADPSTKDAAGPSTITNAKSRRLAQLTNFRYRMILGYLQHFFLYSVHGPDLIKWIFRDMPTLAQLAGNLVKLPRTPVENLADRAGPPFELPYSLALPDREVERWRTHHDVLVASLHLLELTIADGTLSSAAGKAIRDVDTVRLKLIEGYIANPSPAPAPQPTPSGGMPVTPQEAMLALIQTRQPEAQLRHGGIPVPGGKLRDLFKNSKFDDILAFLRSGSAIRDPATGKKLVVPGNLAESGFFIQISAGGVMEFFFSDEERETVRQWIMSLPTS